MSPGKKAGKKALAHKSSSRAEPFAALLDMAAPGPLKFQAPGNAARHQEGRYVYGVIESRTQAGFGHSNLGGGNQDVYTVHHGNLAAVVSRTPVFIFDPTRDN